MIVVVYIQVYIRTTRMIALLNLHSAMVSRSNRMGQRRTRPYSSHRSQHVRTHGKIQQLGRL